LELKYWKPCEKRGTLVVSEAAIHDSQQRVETV
jgi:hypothetical protein